MSAAVHIHIIRIINQYISGKCNVFYNCTRLYKLYYQEMSEAAKKKGSAGKKRSRADDEDDTEEALGVRKKLKSNAKTKFGKKKTKMH